MEAPTDKNAIAFGKFLLLSVYVDRNGVIKFRPENVKPLSGMKIETLYQLFKSENSK